MDNSRIAFDEVTDIWSFVFFIVGAAYLDSAIATVIAIAFLIYIGRELHLGYSLVEAFPILVGPAAAQRAFALATLFTGALILALRSMGLGQKTSAVLVLETGLVGFHMLGVALLLYGKLYSGRSHGLGTLVLNTSTARLYGVVVIFLILGVLFVLLSAISNYCGLNYYPYFLLSKIAMLIASSSFLLIFIHFSIDESGSAKRKDFWDWLDATNDKVEK